MDNTPAGLRPRDELLAKLDGLVADADLLDIHAVVAAALSEAAERIRVQGEACRGCDGSGARRDDPETTAIVECWSCNGTGHPRKEGGAA